MVAIRREIVLHSSELHIGNGGVMKEVNRRINIIYWLKVWHRDLLHVYFIIMCGGTSYSPMVAIIAIVLP